MRSRNHRDLYAGLMFIVIGLAALVYSQSYQIGTAGRMGPGYFPAMLGLVLAILGVAISGRSFLRSAPELRVSKIVWQPLAFILGSVVLFAITLQWLGFAIAMLLLIVVSSFGGHDARLRDTLISYVVLLVLTYLVFFKGLAVQFPAWPVFLVK